MVSVAEAADAQYQPSGREVVGWMVDLGSIKPGDLVVDLGCGDGRLVIAAVRERGAKGLCVERDPRMLREAKRRAEVAGVLGRIEFREQDLFTVDLRPAQVVFVFLNDEMNARLAPKLRAELAPGARVVSHWYALPGWVPDEVLYVTADGRRRPLYSFIR